MLKGEWHNVILTCAVGRHSAIFTPISFFLRDDDYGSCSDDASGLTVRSPPHERLSRVTVRQDTDSDTLTNTVPDTDNVDLTPKHKINTPILEETESTLEAEEMVRSRRGRKG